jgi:hypothetical protein
MKKLTLTSLLAVFAVSGAHAANVIDGNPLYMPKAGHFYSETALESHSEATKDWTLGEEFGYGVTDKLAVSVRTSLTEAESFDDYAWEDLGIKATFRALDMGGWKVDAYGEYAAAGYLFAHSKALDDNFWFKKGLIDYTWTAGLRAGYTTPTWTVAGHGEFVYLNSESFNWNDDGIHAVIFGLDGQYVLCDHLSLVAGVEYLGFLDDGAKNDGMWEGTFGVNYNIDATKYVGAYISGDMNHKGGDNADEWDIEKGFGFGVKFGVDF